MVWYLRNVTISRKSKLVRIFSKWILYIGDLKSGKSSNATKSNERLEGKEKLSNLGHIQETLVNNERHNWDFLGLYSWILNGCIQDNPLGGLSGVIRGEIEQ